MLKDKEIFSGDLFNLVKRLFPICRSITGNGVKQTFKILKSYLPLLKTFEVPTGTKSFDWTIPKEWNIKDAYVKNSKGKKIIDFQKNNLHVLQYSKPVNKKLSLKELKKNLYTLPDQPNSIPYVTSFYTENWGFCLTQNEYEKLKEDEYEVVIDSTLQDGYLTYGEIFLQGKSKEEILFSTHICHPSMCNDNLSGIAVLTFLAQYLSKLNLKYSYRFVFVPEMIGAITWLSLNENKVKNIKGGFTVTCVGDSGEFTYKKTRDGNSFIDKISQKVLFDSKTKHEVIDFSPYGSDERQYSSLGFNLQIGSLMRTPYCRYPEFHTSDDNLDFINKESLFESYQKYLDIIFILENDEKYINLYPKCELQLGKRGLYREIGGGSENPENQLATLWILNFSDGFNSLLDIAIRSKINFKTIKSVADKLLKANLIKIKDDFRIVKNKNLN